MPRASITSARHCARAAGRRSCSAAATPRTATRGSSNCTPTDMKLQLPASFALPQSLANLSARDRKLLALGAGAAALLLLFGIIMPLNHSVTRERARLAHKRADLAFVQGAAEELRNAPPPPAGGG